ncbi:MAG: hypothetical protein ACI9TH_005143 [Kiritimatiellia bacterium]|jgi:hypothetical protein
MEPLKYIASCSLLAFCAGCASTRPPVIPEGFVDIPSTYIDAASYDPTSETLTVRYEDTCVHRISGVSVESYLRFMKTSGKRGYYDTHFRYRPHEIVQSTTRPKVRTRRVVGMRYKPNGESEVVYRGPLQTVE